jgi:arylsulfatase A-like enzyme
MPAPGKLYKTNVSLIGQMDEYLRGQREYFQGKPGYEGYLNWRVAALSEILQDAGYHTIMSGKWHLGLKPEVAPCSRGFDKSFSFLPGSGNHYAWEPQLAEGIKHPPCIKTKDFWMKEDNFINIFTDLPKDFYSTKSFTDQLIQYLQERDPSDEKPFLAYLPFTAPHWPLQAPKDVMKKYGEFYCASPQSSN